MTIATPSEPAPAVQPDLAEAAATARSGHVIVCGLNDVGLRIVEQLRSAGEQVLVIDDGGSPRLNRIVAGLRVELLAGDARRRSTLTAAGLHTAAAFVCVEDNDLANLEISLLVRDVAPQVRLVVQLTNAAVGRAVERLTGASSVLDTATLAAPSFVEACLRTPDHELDVGGQRFVVTERRVEHTANLRSVFGDLAPIAVVPAAGGDMEVCPGRDLTVHAGDIVTLVGTAGDLLDRRALPDGSERDVRVHWTIVRRGRWLWQSLATTGSEIERAFWLTMVSLAAVALFSVALLMANYHGSDGRRMGVIDAVYFTTETLTTVGFGDFYFAHQHAWLRLWAILLMVLGATLVTVLYARLTDFLITRRLAATAGRRRATAMTGHIILIGLGSVGLRVLESLRNADRDVVVLERDENNRYLAAARDMGVPVVIGDSTLRQNLVAANIEAAAAIAVLTSNDLANIETGLAVDDLLGERRAGVPVVLRVFDRQLASTIEKNFGFRYVRSTSALAAPWFVGAALGLTILNTFYVETQPFMVGMLTVAAGGGLTGRPMSDLSARIRVIAIRRARQGGNLEHPPRRDTRFEAGDEAYLVGPYEELLLVLRRERGSGSGSH